MLPEGVSVKFEAASVLLQIRDVISWRSVLVVFKHALNYQFVQQWHTLQSQMN